MITAQDAVDDLYRIAVTEEKATSTSRLDVLADLCLQELTRRGLKGEQPYPVAQHAVIEQDRRPIEHDNIDRVSSLQRVHQVRRQIRLVPEGTGVSAGFVNVNGDVDVTVGTRIRARLRAEQISLEDLCPGLQCPRQSLHERTVDPPPFHVCIMRYRRGAVQGGPAVRGSPIWNPHDVTFWTTSSARMWSCDN